MSLIIFESVREKVTVHEWSGFCSISDAQLNCQITAKSYGADDVTYRSQTIMMYENNKEFHNSIVQYSQINTTQRPKVTHVMLPWKLATSLISNSKATILRYIWKNIHNSKVSGYFTVFHVVHIFCRNCLVFEKKRRKKTCILCTTTKKNHFTSLTHTRWISATCCFWTKMCLSPMLLGVKSRRYLIILTHNKLYNNKKRWGKRLTVSSDISLLSSENSPFMPPCCDSLNEATDVCEYSKQNAMSSSRLECGILACS